MRRAAALAVLLACVAVGCGGEDEPNRPEVARQLGALCEKAREDIEALGLPADVGFDLIPPWAARGTRLADAVAELEGTTPAERTELRSLSAALREYYAGLRLGHTVYTRTRSLDAYAVAVERATTFLERAESLARRLDAPECTVRPFPDR